MLSKLELVALTLLTTATAVAAPERFGSEFVDIMVGAGLAAIGGLVSVFKLYSKPQAPDLTRFQHIANVLFIVLGAFLIGFFVGSGVILIFPSWGLYMRWGFAAISGFYFEISNGTIEKWVGEVLKKLPGGPSK